MKRLLIIIICALALCACGNRPHQTSSHSESESESDAQGDSESVRMAVTSATHVGFLAALDALDCIVAVANPQLIYSLPKEAKYIDIGSDLQPNIESLLMAKPDVVLVTGYGTQEPTWWKQVREFGIEILAINEWQETDPIARAGWIRRVGAIVHKEAMADSIFQSRRGLYDSIAALQPPTLSPTLMSGQSFRGTWYVPTGQSFMGKIFQDAGARYAYASDTSRGSLPLSVEQALLTFHDADVWVGVDVRSMDELAALDPRHTWFKAYERGRVYNYLKRSTPAGANDFWERGVVCPDEILDDIRHVLYPDSTYTFHYLLGVGE